MVNLASNFLIRRRPGIDSFSAAHELKRTPDVLRTVFARFVFFAPEQRHSIFSSMAFNVFLGALPMDLLSQWNYKEFIFISFTSNLYPRYRLPDS